MPQKADYEDSANVPTVHRESMCESLERVERGKTPIAVGTNGVHLNTAKSFRGCVFMAK